MISYKIETDVIVHSKDGAKNRKTFYPKDADVVANANGTYTIHTPVPPRDADLAVTKDTQRVFMYDEDAQAWWEQ